ncbi:MAG: SlyX family protein [Spirochaetia bacterium]|jgi:uncharacterized coiled-coil protein SlyX|nr:SlyX family protein [Spirochaetia bacterium]
MDQIVTIEAKLAFLESSINDIGILVYDYGKRIERMEEGMRQMARRLAELGDEKSGPMPAGERPPHY